MIANVTSPLQDWFKPEICKRSEELDRKAKMRKATSPD
jgi:hypothetical protein